MFIAKDGFLLYYGEKTNPNASHFDTKPKVSTCYAVLESRQNKKSYNTLFIYSGH